MCRGHFHAPGTKLPLSEFSVHRGTWQTGKPFAKCKRCTVWLKQHPKGDKDWNTYIPLERVMPIIEELSRRIGKGETARRAGLYIDVLTIGRLRKTKGMRKSTVDKLVRVLVQARQNGEDGFDRLAVSRSNLIPGGPPGARQRATRAMVVKWERRRHRRERQRFRREIASGDNSFNNEQIMKMYPVDMTSPDNFWWHNTGQEWLPRYGEEMLGSDF